MPYRAGIEVTFAGYSADHAALVVKRFEWHHVDVCPTQGDRMVRLPPTDDDRVRAIVRYLSLSPSHRARLARRSKGAPPHRAPLWLDPTSWEAALDAGVVQMVHRPYGPRLGDWIVGRGTPEKLYAVELVEPS